MTLQKSPGNGVSLWPKGGYGGIGVCVGMGLFNEGSDPVTIGYLTKSCFLDLRTGNARR